MDLVSACLNGGSEFHNSLRSNVIKSNEIYCKYHLKEHKFKVKKT